LHALLDFTSLLVELGQLPGQAHRSRRVVGQQTRDPDAHVGQSPRRVQPRPHHETQVSSRQLIEFASAGLQQSPNSGHAPAGAYATQALRHQHPVVVVQRHHIGDSSQSNQIEQISGAKTGIVHETRAETMYRKWLDRLTDSRASPASTDLARTNYT
jgi:hypothetical protein